MLPQDFPWAPNLYFVRHLPPPEHAAFLCASAVTVNVTRAPMAEMGFCPSGRLFEAASCGVPVLTDDWDGLDTFFVPGEEILVARDTASAIAALSLPVEALQRIGEAARRRALASHTADARAEELLELLDGAELGRRLPA